MQNGVMTQKQIQGHVQKALVISGTKTFRMTKGVLKYLHEVWGYTKPEKVDAETAFCILENCEDMGAVNQKTGKVNWPYDFACKQAILKAHKLPNMTAAEFRKRFQKGKAFG